MAGSGGEWGRIPEGNSENSGGRGERPDRSPVLADVAM
jgi:hypothetical protein